MKPRNFPFRKLRRQLQAQCTNTDTRPISYRVSVPKDIRHRLGKSKWQELCRVELKKGSAK